MWTAERAPRRASRKASTKSIDMPILSTEPSSDSLLPPAPLRQPQRHNPASSQGQLTTNVADLFEPAIDGPPSPESIRALNRQMQKSSGADLHQSHQTTSSGSSSLRSRASNGDRPSWENAFEGMSLSRKSSGRSTSSSMPSWDRPDSVQIFGRTIFNRRSKPRRESSNQSSSNSSLNSGDAALETAPPPTSVPSTRGLSVSAGIFGRRRTTRSESTDDSAGQRKLQISGPYNFQHVTHTQRENLPSHMCPNRTGLAPEFSQLRSSQAPPKVLRGIHADGLQFTDPFNNQLLDGEEEVSPRSKPVSRPQLNKSLPPLVSYAQAPPPHKRSPKHARSHEQVRIPPPRPPRSPAEPDFAPAPPVPPPRISSRASIRYDGFDPQSGANLNRPQTGGGGGPRRPHPHPFYSSSDASPPSTSYGYTPKSSLDTLTEYASPLSPGPREDTDWPLPNPSNAAVDASLPGVPEEVEGGGGAILTHRSRQSTTSNTSSLRGSQSVPLLRHLPISQPAESRRRSSGASETLGCFDIFAAQKALRTTEVEEQAQPEPEDLRDNWEDDIDYCYEHAAEADCEYAWDRPSFDISMAPSPDHTLTDVDVDAAGAKPLLNRTSRDRSEVSPSMLSPAQFDVPALSPASQASITPAQEAITPTTLVIPKTSNFSLPRAEASAQVQKRVPHVRNPSEASSFKESHGFNLSPSLLIPEDFRREMLASEADEPLAHELPYQTPYGDTPLNMDTSMLLINSRISASTTMSNDTDRTRSERHVSTTSASTDATRLTASTTSLDMENFIPKNDPIEPTPRLEESEFFHSRAKSQGMMPILRESDADQTITIRRDATHGSYPDLVKLASKESATAMKVPPKRKDPLLTRRRARTTSLSTPPPPGQYALFPSVQITGPRI